MRKLATLIALLATGMLLSGCTSLMVKEILRSTQIPNWVYVHSDPRPGDYAIHRTAQGPLVRYEIKSVSPGRIEISQRFVDLGNCLMWGSGLDELEHRVFVDEQGYVQEAFLLEDNGRKTKLPIATAGENGFVANVQDVSVPGSGLLHVDAGYFAVTELRIFEMYSIGPYGPNTLTVVHYGNPEVNFGIVKIAGYQSSSVSITDLADFIKDAGTSLAAGLVLKFLEDKYMQIEAELIEQGNSNDKS